MENDDLAQLLDQVGQKSLTANPVPGADLLLCAQVDTNMVDKTLFVDRGADILAIFPEGRDFTYLMLDLWEAQPPGKRWREMEYLVRGGRFTTTFIYPDDVDPEASFDRRAQIVRQYFGDKPIVYATDERSEE